MSAELVIRAMTRADLDRALGWAAAEGWNPGAADAAGFLAADPGGFLMGFLEGEPVACISVVRYGAAFGFLGLYICRPEFRGRGHGLALWEAGLAHLGDRVVGLDGVVAQQANYARSGFALSFRHIRYAGPATASEATSPNVVEVHGAYPAGLVGSIAAYDRAYFPGPREAFLRGWIGAPERRTVAFVRDNGVRGYGTIRACRSGLKVGPLFADDERIADRLFAALTARHRGAPISLDVPEPNAAAVALAARHGLAPAFETARMYRGTAPALPLARSFGVTTLELG